MKRPLRNILSMLFGEAGSRAVGFAVTVYLARMLAPAAFGLMNIGMSVLGYLILAVSPGMQVVEARNVAAREGVDRDRTGDILSLRLFLAAIAIAAAFLIGELWHPVPETRDVVLLYLLSLFPAALLLDWFFSGKEEMLTLSLSRFLIYAGYGIAVVLLVRASGDVRGAPVAFLFGNCAGAGFLYVIYRKHIGTISLGWHPRRWKPILLENLPVGGAFFLAQSVYSLPPLAIGLFRSNADVGMFSAAMKLAFVVLLIDRIFSAMFLPVVARLWTGNRGDLPELVRVTFRTIAVVMLPLVGLSAAAAPEAIAIVFGPGYEAAVVPFRIVLAFALLTAVNTVFVCVMIGSGNEKIYSRAIARGTLVLALGVGILTPIGGTAGASVGLAAGELATVILMIRAASRVTALPGVIEYLRPAAAAAVMAAVYLALASISPLAGAFVGISAFLGGLWLMGGISPTDIRFVWKRFI